jgi:hypothetical protein
MAYEPLRRSPEKKVTSKSITKTKQIPVKNTFGPANPGTIGLKMETKAKPTPGMSIVKKTIARKPRP